MVRDLAEIEADKQQLWQLASMYWREDRHVLARLSEQELLAMATEHLSSFDHIGFTTSFDADFRHILKDLSIDQPVPQQRQFASREPTRPASLSDRALEALQERLQPEYQLLAEAGRLRRERLGES